MQDTSHSNFIVDFTIAAVTSAFSKTMCAPYERSKLLLRLGGQDKVRYRSYYGVNPPAFLSLQIRALREEGILSLFRGNTQNIIRYVPTQALNFAFRDLYKNTFGHSDNWTKSTIENFLFGSAAGVTSMIFAYPVDYARVSIANDNRSGVRQYHGILDVLKKQGITTLYKGFGISSIGVAVCRGLYFGLYDTLKRDVLPSGWHNNLLACFVLAAFTTSTAQMASYPIDTIRRSLMFSQDQYSIEACKAVVKKLGGFRGLYKGAMSSRFFAGALTLVAFDKLQYMYLTW